MQPKMKTSRFAMFDKRVFQAVQNVYNRSIGAKLQKRKGIVA